jgi:RNA polymerase sigma-70 factor (ECF subfamily)
MISSVSFSDVVESSLPAAAPTDQTGHAGEDAMHDAELVRRFNAGDENAFVDIVSRYREKILAFARTRLRNHADAEDITQDTFIRAYRGLARFRGDSSLATWLRRIVFNLSNNHYWYFFRRHRHATMSLDSTFSDENQAIVSDLIASHGPSPVREEMTREFLAQVAVCMKKLSDDQREILTLCNGLNSSYSDIARTLGINIGTVKSRIGRARINLRALLAETYGEFGPDSSPSDWFEHAQPSSRLEIVYS